MAQPLRTDLIKQRLKEQVAVLQEVKGSADYAALEKRPPTRVPSAYVVLTHETSSTELAGSGHEVTAQFAVVVAVRNYRDDTGVAAQDDADTVISATRQALEGFRPSGREFHKVRWKSGKVLRYDGNTLLWADLYTAKYFIN